MKHFYKTLLAICLLTIMVMGTATVSQAANKGKYPGKVTGLTASNVQETNVTLRWNASTNTTGYNVYLVTGGTKKQIFTTSAPGCKITGLQINNSYSFQVYSYKKKAGKINLCSTGSNVVSITTKAVSPARVTGLTVGVIGDRNVTLDWNNANGADGYIVYAYNDATKEFARVATTGNNSALIKGLSAGKTYRFKVDSYHTYDGVTTFGGESNEVSVKAKHVDMDSVYGRCYNASVRSTATGTVVGTGKTITVNKGTRGTITDVDRRVVFFKMSNGVTVKLPKSKMNFNSFKWTRKYFTKDQVETYVNSRGVTSKTNYMIWLSHYTCAVYILKGYKGHWNLVRTMPCVIGAKGTATPQGHFTICKKSYKYGDVIDYVKWYGGSVGGWGFHKRVSSLARGCGSHGCIRLGTADLHFLHNNCKIGTRVFSY